jgi:ABC-type transport system involved in cytochrome bd biosynthesis fused ATPase/permease subunit
MFGGTLRTDLDLFNKYTDKTLLDVLYKCFAGADARSQCEYQSRGLGIQLLSRHSTAYLLGACYVDPSRILVLDEATAGLDSDANAAVQQGVENPFSQIARSLQLHTAWTPLLTRIESWL